jgi:hypothetical protein
MSDTSSNSSQSPSRTLSENDLQELLITSPEHHVDFLPLFQDLITSPGFESLYSPILDSYSTTSSPTSQYHLDYDYLNMSVSKEIDYSARI